jgi:two-component system LytT family response regulator
MSLRVLLVDDEAPARARLRRLLEATGRVEIVGEAGNGEEALEATARLAPDALFLDVQMPELDGFGVAQALGADGPRVVFATAYDEFALKAFDAAAVDYLVKPIAAERLHEALRKLESFAKTPAGQASLPSRSSKLAIRTGSKFVVFEPAQVTAVVARDHYAGVLVNGRELLSDDSLEAMEKRLPSDRFFRIHRGAIINLDFLRELDREGDRKYAAVLSDSAKTRLPVSRDRLNELRERLGATGARSS